MIMAAFTITEVTIGGVDVRVGDWVTLTWRCPIGPVRDERVSGTVTSLLAQGDDIEIYMEGDGSPPLAYVPMPIHEISGVTRQPREGDDIEREAIISDAYPTAWARVLDGEGAP